MALKTSNWIKKVVSKHAAYFMARVCGRQFDYGNKRIHQFYQYIEDIDEPNSQSRDGLYKSGNTDTTLYQHVHYNYTDIQTTPIQINPELPPNANQGQIINGIQANFPAALPVTIVRPIPTTDPTPDQTQKVVYQGRTWVLHKRKVEQLNSSIEGATTFRVVAFPRVRDIYTKHFRPDGSPLRTTSSGDLYWDYNHYFRNIKLYRRDICNPLSEENPAKEKASAFYCPKLEVERDLIRAIGAVKPSDGTVGSEQDGILNVCFKATYQNIKGMFLKDKTEINTGDLLRSMKDTGNPKQSTVLIDYLSDWWKRTEETVVTPNNADGTPNQHYLFWHSKGNLTDGPQTTREAYEPLTDPNRYRNKGGLRVKKIWDQFQAEWNKKSNTWTRRELFSAIIAAARQQFSESSAIDLNNNRREGKDAGRTFQGFNTSNTYKQVSEINPESGQLFFKDRNHYLDEVDGGSGYYDFQPEYEFSLQMRRNRDVSLLQSILTWWFERPVNMIGSLPDLPTTEPEFLKRAVKEGNEWVVTLPNNIEFVETNEVLLPGIDTFLVTTTSPRLVRETSSVFLDVGARSSGRVQRVQKQGDEPEPRYQNTDRGAGIIQQTPNAGAGKTKIDSLTLDNQFTAENGAVQEFLEKNPQFAGRVDPELLDIANSNKISKPVFLRHYTHTQVNIPPTLENLQRIDMFCDSKQLLCCMLTFWDGFRTHLDFSRLSDILFRVINPKLLEVLADENGNVSAVKALMDRILKEEIMSRAQTSKFSITESQETDPSTKFSKKVGTPELQGFNKAETASLSSQLLNIQADLTTPTTAKMREDFIESCFKNRPKNSKTNSTSKKALDACDIGYPIGGTPVTEGFSRLLPYIPSLTTTPPQQPVNPNNDPNNSPPIGYNPPPPVDDPNTPTPNPFKTPKQITKKDCLTSVVVKAQDRLTNISGTQSKPYREKTKIRAVIEKDKILNAVVPTGTGVSLVPLFSTNTNQIQTNSQTIPNIDFDKTGSFFGFDSFNNKLTLALGELGFFPQDIDIQPAGYDYLLNIAKFIGSELKTTVNKVTVEGYAVTKPLGPFSESDNNIGTAIFLTNEDNLSRGQFRLIDIANNRAENTRSALKSGNYSSVPNANPGVKVPSEIIRSADKPINVRKFVIRADRGQDMRHDQSKFLAEATDASALLTAQKNSNQYKIKPTDGYYNYIYGGNYQSGNSVIDDYIKKHDDVPSVSARSIIDMALPGHYYQLNTLTPKVIQWVRIYNDDLSITDPVELIRRQPNTLPGYIDGNDRARVTYVRQGDNDPKNYVAIVDGKIDRELKFVIDRVKSKRAEIIVELTTNTLNLGTKPDSKTNDKSTLVTDPTKLDVNKISDNIVVDWFKCPEHITSLEILVQAPFTLDFKTAIPQTTEAEQKVAMFNLARNVNVATQPYFLETNPWSKIDNTKLKPDTNNQHKLIKAGWIVGQFINESIKRGEATFSKLPKGLPITVTVVPGLLPESILTKGGDKRYATLGHDDLIKIMSSQNDKLPADTLSWWNKIGGWSTYFKDLTTSPKDTEVRIDFNVTYSDNADVSCLDTFKTSTTTTQTEKCYSLALFPTIDIGYDSITALDPSNQNSQFYKDATQTIIVAALNAKRNNAKLGIIAHHEAPTTFSNPNPYAVDALLSGSDPLGVARANRLITIMKQSLGVPQYRAEIIERWGYLFTQGNAAANTELETLRISTDIMVPLSGGYLFPNIDSNSSLLTLEIDVTSGLDSSTSLGTKSNPIVKKYLNDTSSALITGLSVPDQTTVYNNIVNSYGSMDKKINNRITITQIGACPNVDVYDPKISTALTGNALILKAGTPLRVTGDCIPTVTSSVDAPTTTNTTTNQSSVNDFCSVHITYSVEINGIKDRFITVGDSNPRGTSHQINYVLFDLKLFVDKIINAANQESFENKIVIQPFLDELQTIYQAIPTYIQTSTQDYEVARPKVISGLDELITLGITYLDLCNQVSPKPIVAPNGGSGGQVPNNAQIEVLSQDINP